ncbi:MAG: diaminopimelate decarboxylase [SAR202 cluster bacterium]|nr:diaminopimelate decarboxylase [SAR202 cluster bacterium]|tara:strand:- start:13129 stop:14439 length:1311 start_codon:yes stop_codon:yes gene_type:complete
MVFENSIFPITSEVNSVDHLVLGGCDVTDLMEEFGSPLYVYDEVTLRSMCKEFVSEFSNLYSESSVLYAAKAFLNPAIANIVREEGLGMDVVSGGELAVAINSGFPADSIYFHGNNKTRDELEYAIQEGVSRIVIDSFHEIDLLEDILASKNSFQDVMIRISPNVDPHTHIATTTGILDSKFGFAIETGDAARAIRQLLKSQRLDLVGIHFHLGSPIFELEPYESGVRTILKFLQPFIKEGLNLREFSPGGGFAIGYLSHKLPPSIKSYAQVIVESTKKYLSELGFHSPKLIVEPGRSIVGRAGVALYTVGAIKDIPGVRKYVSLDGGMGDNIRPALYDAEYEAVIANKTSLENEEVVTLAGKYCESGDILIRDIKLPKLVSGDIVAIPASGAYAPSMASNYNLNPRPPIALVNEGSAKLIRERETYQDMIKTDKM